MAKGFLVVLGGPSSPARGPVEAGDDLLVGGGGEVCVELADGSEGLRLNDRDELVGHLADAVDPPGCGDRRGEDDASSALSVGHLAGGPGRGAGGDPVVDDDHGAPCERGPGATTAEMGRGALERGSSVGFGGRELGRGHVGSSQHLAVQHAHASLSDGAHGELGLAGRAQLVDDDYIEGSVEGCGDLERNRYATARESDNDWRLGAHVFKAGGQRPPRGGAIREGRNHDASNRDT